MLTTHMHFASPNLKGKAGRGGSDTALARLPPACRDRFLRENPSLLTLRRSPGIAGPRVSHPQRVASHANVGTRFNLPLRSFRCGWGQPRSKEACWSAGISPNLTRAICAVGSGDARRYLGESLGTSCCCLAAENSPSPRGRYDYYRRGEINARVAQVAPPLPVLRSCRQRKGENRAGKNRDSAWNLPKTGGKSGCRTEQLITRCKRQN